MGKSSKQQIINTLLKTHGQLYSKEIGIPLPKGTPSALFQWLIASILFSARIRDTIAVEAARSLCSHGWKNARRLGQSTWQKRVQALHDAGYSRYQEKTASMLGETANFLLEKYNGDIRKLRKVARHRPVQERQLLKECKGMGNVGVDIFFREMQMSWDELIPFADRRALKTAKKLKLGDSAKALADLTTRKKFPVLIAALIRVGRDNLHKDILDKASP